MHPSRDALVELAETVGGAVVPVATVFAVLAASAIALAAAIRWLQGRRGSTRARETLFVGRWGVFGPELYLVGKRVRRLAGPQDATATLAFARRMLAEVMRCRPATRLARAFADAQLEPLPRDGFVLSTADVKAWLESRQDSLRTTSAGTGPYPPA
jgi:hypothetical protein